MKICIYLTGNIAQLIGMINLDFSHGFHDTIGFYSKPRDRMG